jgi:hypothetical protein
LPPNLSKVGEDAILSRTEFVRLWFFDIRILPVTLCCLDKVLGPGVAGVLRVVYVRPGPSTAPSSSVCSSASSPMTGECSRRLGRLMFEGCEDRMRRLRVGEEAVVAGSRSLAASSSMLAYVPNEAFDLGMLD